jgi:hypothetical protein
LRRLDIDAHNGCTGVKDDSMRRCFRCQAAIKRNAVTLMALLGLLVVAGCASPRSNLSDPARFGIIEHALRTDLVKVVHDLQREHTETSDAGAGPSGPGAGCYKLKNNVNYVTLTTIRNFVLGTVTADRNSLQSNINHIRSDRSNFEKDMLDFVNDGVARPAGATRTVREITKKINHAKATANSIISRINNKVRNAYGIANGFALNRCPNNGPGSHMPHVAPLT